MLSKQAQLKAAAALQGRKVCIIGDLMLDHYMIGTVDRISPEAPVPVVRVTNETRVLGGAGNVAQNIAALGGSPVLFGCTGDDPDGAALVRMTGEAGIESRILKDPARPTTRKTRIIAHNQQVVRVDSEQPDPLPQNLLDELFSALRDVLPHVPVIVLSDYGKGIICREFMSRLMDMVNPLPRRPLILVDPKPVNYDLYKGVDLLTPNTKEAGEGAGLAVSGRDSVLAAGQALFKRLRCKHLLVTLGAGGMALFETPETVRQIPTVAQKVFDVTGAGDTVIATLALALAAGTDLLTACALANHAAGHVVAQVGAATASGADLIRSIESLPEIEINAWLG
ncbi:D-glycero-beta-D-manno-heptose-7-phosphate kinase [Desulfovibrio aminophilus]|uniref:D-glycero-beta-D-manno-heptose-7-phosphate kinase n=1 Tax=Desulfovibrio aminophilus TaxID=81425 RepID=UPI000407C1BE|nr:D-glycero-beta-D-manno-heptose-7-phosphate kinase [Desulfovibrio aminophilus]